MNPKKAAIVSGYFNPLHIGHLEMIHAARNIAPYLIVIVNNDAAQMLKKGRIIMPEEHRVRIVQELRSVDEVILAPDQDSTVVEALKTARERHPIADLYFCNGGDRSAATAIPTAEGVVCDQLDITMMYGVGGIDKLDSSTRITSSFSE